MRPLLAGIFAAVLAATLLSPFPAAGHVVSQLYGELRQTDASWELELLFDAGFADPSQRNDPSSPQPDRRWLVELPADQQAKLTEEARKYLKDTIVLEAGGGTLEWTVSFPDFDTDPPSFPSLLNDGAYFHAKIEPSPGGGTAPVAVRVVAGDHPDLVVKLPGDDPVYLTAKPGGAPAVLTEAGEGRTPVVTAFVQGVLHVVPHGLDHIFFVLGIFLLQRRWSALLKQSLAFTAAHTITLGLAAAGLVSVPGKIVEPVIALSITALAVENLLIKEPRAWRLWLVFAFGLVHGLGFAGALSTWLQPGEGFLPTLLAANLGVEVGQVAVLAAAWLATAGWSRSRVWWPRFRGAACIALASAGLWWFAERTGLLSLVLLVVPG